MLRVFQISFPIQNRRNFCRCYGFLLFINFNKISNLLLTNGIEFPLTKKAIRELSVVLRKFSHRSHYLHCSRMRLFSGGSQLMDTVLKQLGLDRFPKQHVVSRLLPGKHLKKKLSQVLGRIKGGNVFWLDLWEGLLGNLCFWEMSDWFITINRWMVTPRKIVFSCDWEFG